MTRPETSSVPPHDLFEGTPYRLVEPLGSGGMGEVFVVLHRELGREFVAKVIHRVLASDERLVDRTRIEAQALGRLNHPHIVSAVGFGKTSDGRPFVVMERLRGRSLGDEIAEQGGLPIGEAVMYTRQLLAALGAAHAIGIVHRDVKPDNLLVCQHQDGTRFVKVLDFGVARDLPGAADAPAPLIFPTETGRVVGTPRFVSPEGATGKRVDHRADIYAAGLVLYAMIAGRGPFDHAKGQADMLSMHASREPVPPSRFAPRPIAPELDLIVMKALRKNPDDRFQSAEDFDRALGGLSLAGTGSGDSATTQMVASRDTASVRVSATVSVSGVPPVPAKAPSPPRAEEERRGPLSPGDRFLKYEIRRALGRGGHAFVYDGYDPFLDRHVAIKIISSTPDRAVELGRRAQVEARVLCKLQHPNVVSVIDAGADDSGHVYIIMELLEGRTLREVLAGGKLPVPEALRIATHVARGVQAAHDVQVIHRDLKPENVIVLADGSVKVLDFGIAKLQDGSGISTREGKIQGTLVYMSPEHLHGRPVTKQSDVYALGSILYEALAGRAPCFFGVEAPTMNALALAQIHKTPPPLDELGAAPAHVARAVQRMLAKVPGERFAGMNEVIAALGASAERLTDPPRSTGSTPSGVAAPPRSGSPPPPGEPSLARALALAGLVGILGGLGVGLASFGRGGPAAVTSAPASGAALGAGPSRPELGPVPATVTSAHPPEAADPLDAASKAP